MHVVLRPHTEIESFLAEDPLTNLFPLYVCAQRPDGSSPAVIEGGRMRGAVVTGALFGINPAGAAWLAADGLEAAEALLAYTAAHGRPRGLQLAWELTPAAKACPGYRVSRDLYLARNTGTVADAPAPHGTFVHIDAQSLAGLAVPPDVGASIGNLATLPSDAPFWGLAVSGRVVAICETMVRYGSVVTVQQVYTATDERRQNHARSLITQLLGHPAVAGTTLTWLVEEKNRPSVALAQGLGFVEQRQLGCLEPV
jgi:ribosomal protein S18 acetylase RimI-like enzyme